jgi:Caspase domain
MDARWWRWVVVCLAGAPGVLGAQGGTPIVYRGTLASGDAQLRSGEYFDTYEFQGRAGQRAVFDLTSSAFDPYLMVIAPSGDKKENDDFNDSNSRSRLDLALEETGTYRIVVTSYKKGEGGAYELRIDAAGSGGGVAAAEPGVRVESGRLAAGDTTLRSGEYRDSYTFQGRQGQMVTVDLRSAAFDPYLIVIDPSGKQRDNDDHEGDSHRSLVSYELPEDGTYRVWATSYKSGETGAYDLRIQVGSAVAAEVAARPRVENGRLAAGDDTLRTGEYVDSYTLEGRPGQHVTVDVASNDFDTYLMVNPPRGERLWNDDVEDRPRHSVIEADLTEAGQYRVAVTSYKRGETGLYELRIDYAAAAAANAPPSSSRDVGAIAYDETQAGTLAADDARLSRGEYRDLYAFEGSTGDSIIVELESSDFDPYLALIPPDGEQIDNDDADGRQDLSRVSLRLRASGRYRILATTYAAEKTGNYRLSLRRAAGGPVTTRPPAATGAGRVYGVFVGISNYGGRANNLMYTADDARRMYDAMQRGAGMPAADAIVLVDQQATLAGVRRAIQRIGSQAGPNDMFVFFYSGHGGRNPRQSFQPADPDNLDETLVFYDDDLTDDALSQLLDGIHAKVSLLVFDACFSGGFSKDVISAPGRMGLFSSEEDVTSGVAVKFRAGGYLAQFIAEAVGGRLADDDGEPGITALELSQYLHERYRADVKSGGPGDSFVRTGGPQTGYQHLVVDRGSIEPYAVLFR